MSKVELDTILTDVAAAQERVDDEGRIVALRVEALTRVAGVLLEGGRVTTESHVTGCISHGNEPLRFACTRKHDGRLIEVFQAYDEGNIDERGPYAITLRERDWSAFAAARAFVDNVGSERALAAILDRGRAPKGPRPRAAEITVAP